MYFEVHECGIYVSNFACFILLDNNLINGAFGKCMATNRRIIVNGCGRAMQYVATNCADAWGLSQKLSIRKLHFKINPERLILCYSTGAIRLLEYTFTVKDKQ